MKPGRELDAFIAEKVFGYSVEAAREQLAYFLGNDAIGEQMQREIVPDQPTIPPYSTDIAAAWQVIEKISADFAWTLELSRNSNPPYRLWLGLAGHHSAILVEADTAPHAICLAALRAVGAVTDNDLIRQIVAKYDAEIEKLRAERDQLIRDSSRRPDGDRSD